MPQGATGVRLRGGEAEEEAGKKERKWRRQHKKKRKQRDWTLILLLQLAKPQHNGPVTQSKQISSLSLNNGSAIAAFSHM